MWSADGPLVCTGMRGLVDGQVDFHGPDGDLHSGSFGGAVPNPVTELARLLGAAARRRRAGDDPRVLRRRRRARPPRSASCSPGCRSTRASSSRPRVSRAASGEAGYTTLERIWARPTAEVNGMWGGYTGPGQQDDRAVRRARQGVLPPGRRAGAAAASSELVPRRGCRRTAARGITARSRSRRRRTAVPDAAGPPGAAGRAAGDVARVRHEVLYTREGGSGPEADLADILGAPVVFLGVGAARRPHPRTRTRRSRSPCCSRAPRRSRTCGRTWPRGPARGAVTATPKSARHWSAPLGRSPSRARRPTRAAEHRGRRRVAGRCLGRPGDAHRARGVGTDARRRRHARWPRPRSAAPVPAGTGRRARGPLPAGRRRRRHRLLRRRTRPRRRVGSATGAAAAGLREVGRVLATATPACWCSRSGWRTGTRRTRAARAAASRRRWQQAGFVRRCTADGSEHYPRTDPAVIVLVTDAAATRAAGQLSRAGPAGALLDAGRLRRARGVGRGRGRARGDRGVRRRRSREVDVPGQPAMAVPVVADARVHRARAVSTPDPVADGEELARRALVRPCEIGEQRRATACWCCRRRSRSRAGSSSTGTAGRCPTAPGR